MTVIAMTREMGSLGKDVALGLSVQLGLAVVHHELVEKELAGKLDVGESEVHRFLEGHASLLERWKIDQNRLSQCTAEEILQLAERDNIVIRGWGATQLLKDVPHVIRVRVCAPMANRIKRMMERMGIADEAVARREIERSDNAHSRVMHSFFGTDWENPVNYHIVLNTACVPIQTCIDEVRMLAECNELKATETSRGILADKIIEARIRGAIDDDKATGMHSRNFDIEVTGGKVAISGAALSQPQIDAVLQLVRNVDGVTGVENDIVFVAPTPMV